MIAVRTIVLALFVATAVILPPGCPDGAKYVSSDGVAWLCRECVCVPYFAELEVDNDPGYCGIAPFETGSWDPLWKVCRRHDAMFDWQKDHEGQVEESILKTNATFIGQALAAGVIGAGTLVWSIIASVLVVAVGVPRQTIRWLRRNNVESAGDL